MKFNNIKTINKVKKTNLKYILTNKHYKPNKLFQMLFSAMIANRFHNNPLILIKSS